MAIRVFISKWNERQLDGGGVQVTDAISDYLADVSLSAPVVSVNNYGATDPQNGNRPSATYLLKVMRGNITEQEWQDIEAAGDVSLIPSWPFDYPVASLSNPEKNQVRQALNFVGIRENVVLIDGETYGQFLRNILAYMNADNVDFGDWENYPAEWGA